MKTILALLVALSVALPDAPLQAQTQGPMDALEIQDVRLASIAERMMRANDGLCRQHMPLTGMLIHTRDQYRSDPGTAFANGPVAVEAVVPGSASAQVVRAGDALVAVGAVRTDSLHAEAPAPLRDAVFWALADTPADRPVSLTIARAGMEEALTVNAPPGCRALVEIRSGNGKNARSDGRVIQIDYGLAAAANDDQLAVIFAHELGHAVLEHRRRLGAARVSKGFFGEFGKNGKLNRQAEIEADRMSVHLLADAGYDPRIAPAFWRSPLGRRVGNGLSFVYPNAEARAKLLDDEIANHMNDMGLNELLAQRDRPFE